MERANDLLERYAQQKTTLLSFTVTSDDGTQTRFVPESDAKERQLLLDQIELLKARNKSLGQLVRDFQHLILWNFYDMRTDEWRIQRNALLNRVEELQP